MSRLTDLITKVKAENQQLGTELEREFKMLSSQVPFGLNFERHRPEVVELPQRPVRRGDKVRVLPPRGTTIKGDQRLWLVKSVDKSENKAYIELISTTENETQSIAVDDLVVVVEFGDKIYPGLVSTGKVSRASDKPWHTVINGENYHVLKMLTWTHRGKVDAIYIDPPYNTGAKDWKYNNNYVESDDLYRHSKWLAMMERRLLVAKELLNPLNSVLIVTIDEKEYLRLGLLLEQVFPDAQIEMVSSIINPKGTGRSGGFARINEFIFFVRFGKATVSGRQDGTSIGTEVSWETMRRRNLASKRGQKGKGACGPNQFYPIYVDINTGAIVGRGKTLPNNVPRTSITPPEGTLAVFPVRADGTEMNWEYTDVAFDCWWPKGYIRANGLRDEPQACIIQHLPNKVRNEIEEGVAIIESRRSDNSVVVKYVKDRTKHITTQWDYTSHSAERGGTGIIKSLIPGRKFPFPKSLYAVEDCLRLFLKKNPKAIILDFFSGSGTTAHAVMRLNKQDGGKRQCISITNNEVGADEQKALREKGLRPGDVEWERWGICEYITKPRVEAAITGNTPDGQPIKGNYKFTDIFPMAEGLEENAEFFTLSYDMPISISYQTAFARIAPMLWLRAGSVGRRIEQLPLAGWDVVDAYGLLVELDKASDFLTAIHTAAKEVRIAYIVTDDEHRFQALARQLPESVEAIRLYESYLTNFAFCCGLLPNIGDIKEAIYYRSNP